jgi:hypothetical protein
VEDVSATCELKIEVVRNRPDTKPTGPRLLTILIDKPGANN